MTKVIVKLEKDFTVIPNEIIRNKEMSCNSKMILITMLSLPPDWNFTINGLTAILKEGRDTIRNALIEIEKFGYLKRERERKEDGTLGAMIYTVYQFPQSAEPTEDKPMLENPTQAEPTLDFNNEYNTNINKTKNDKEQNLSNKELLSTENNNALKDVRRSSFKGNIYAPFSEKKGGHGEQSRFIPPDYTYEQLREHIKKPVTDYAKSEYGNDDKAELITNIVIMFCQKYERIFGSKHPVLSDKAYERIVDRYFDPPEEMCDYDDLKTYEVIADRYFTVNFNQQGRYDGEITKSLSHFMSAAIRENLFLQTCR